MPAPQPTLRLGRDVWDRDAMPVDEFADRAARLRAGMGRHVSRADRGPTVGDGLVLDADTIVI